MTTRKSTAKALFISVFSLVLVAGCMSATKNDKDKEDREAAARSKAYLDSVEVVTADSLSGKQKACTLPANIDKSVVAKNTAAPSKDWQLLIEYANACAQQKNWRTLETLANAIARTDLDSPWGAYFLSLSAEGTGDYQRALWMADLAQKKAGGRTGLYFYQRGRILFAMKDTVHAMKEIATAVDLDPKLAEGHFFLAEIHRRDLEDKKAIEEYQAVLAVNPNHYEALTTLGDMKLAQNSVDDSVEFFNRAIKAHPERLLAWLRLGAIYETVKKDTDLALATYKDLRSSIDKGSLQQRPDFDLSAKIKSLEATVLARVPAQAQAAQPTEKTKSVK